MESKNEMNTLNQKIETEKQNISLFSPANRIAYLDTLPDTSSKYIKVDYSNIETIVRSVFRSNRKHKNLPMGVLIVTEGPTASQTLPVYSSRLLTNWLIDYLENGNQTEELTVPVQHNLSNDQINGVYLWPIPYIIFTKFPDKETEENSVLWILYVDRTAPEELKTFARLSASMTLQNHFVAQEGPREMKQRLIEQFDAIQFAPAKIPPHFNEPLILQYFTDYLQWIADSINAKGTSVGKESEVMETELEIGGKVEPECHPNTEEKVISETSEKLQQHEIILLDEPDSCEKYQCLDKLQSAEATLAVWVISCMDRSNSSNIIQILEAHLNFSDQHGILKETQDLVLILNQFISELSNMFDNYVCFYGENDAKQMNRFFMAAKARAEFALEIKNHVHSTFTSSILGKSFQKIAKIFQEDNNSIIEMEVKLIKDVCRRVLEAYQEKLKTTFPSTQPHLLTDVNSKLVQQSIWITTRCLGYSAKLNTVVSQHLKIMETEMNKIYENFLSTLPKLSSAPEKINTTNVLITKCLSFYTQELETVYQEFTTKSRKERKQCHDQMVEKAVQNLKSQEHIDQACLYLNGYFTHVNDMCEQASEKSNADRQNASSNQATLCIHLTPEMMQVVATTEQGNMMLQFGPNLASYFPPMLALTHTNKFLFGFDAVREARTRPSTVRCSGGVTQFVLNTVKNVSLSEQMLADLFVNLKHQAEKGFKTAGPYSNVLIVVPSWFDYDNRGMIRDACRRAKFNQVFMISEAALAAHLVLDGHGHSNDSISDVVVISLTCEEVDIRIFSRKDVSNQVIKLAAMSRSKVFSPEGEIISGDRLQSVIRVTYEKALTQLCSDDDDLQTTKGKKWAVICESPNWLRTALSRFLEEGELFAGIIYLREHEKILNVVMKLSHKPEEIGSTLQDYCMSLLFSHENSVVADNIDGILSGDKLSKEEKRKEIRRKIKHVRQQIADGSVRLGVLSRKLVTRVLDSAEVIVLDEFAKMDELLRQENEVDELFEQYKFNH